MDAPPTPFPFMQLPKEIRMLIYEHLAFSAQHLTLLTGPEKLGFCRENAPPVVPTLGSVTLITPCVPGVPLLCTSRLLAAEASPFLLPALRKCTRTPPRISLAYSDLTAIMNSAFWSVLQRTLQTLICRRRYAMLSIAEHQRQSTAKICSQHHIPCVIKTPRAQTKVVWQDLRHMNEVQVRGYLKFLVHARRHYRFLQDIGVRKNDAGRVELTILLKGDALRTGSWAVAFHERRVGTEMLRVQFVTLEEEMFGEKEAEQVAARWKGVRALEVHLRRGMGARGRWPERRIIGESVSAEEWEREWAEG